MQTYKCPFCKFLFTEADKEWDAAIALAKCPECLEPLRDFPVPLKPHKEKSLVQQRYEAVIGDNNRIYYMTKFERFDQRGEGLQPSWNWAAYFGAGWWMVYRKMYGWSLVLFGIEILSGFLRVAIEISNSLIEVGLVLLIVFLLNIPVVIFADSLYHRSVKKKIATAQQSIKDEAQLLEFLRYKGGVNTWIIWVGISVPVVGIIAAIGMAAYSDFLWQGRGLFLATLCLALLVLVVAFVGISVKKRKMAQGKTDMLEERLYAQIAQELDTNTVDRALWTKAYAEVGGDEKQTRVLYIKQRFARLRDIKDA